MSNVKNKPYHHGNLKQNLIEAGLTLVSEEGEDKLSLRRVASICGVSHAAPYAHFQNKEELLTAMKDYVNTEFLATLQQTLKDFPADNNLMARLGKAYVTFFIRNPHYFSFLFSQTEIAVELSLDSASENDYPPYTFFKQVALISMNSAGIPKEQQNDTFIAMWSLVHGLASIATMKNVTYEHNLEEHLESIITSFGKGETI